jgi:hypothetical protein
LVYHGKGGFTWESVYSFPVWLRRFYIKQINDFINKENEEIEKQTSEAKSKMPKIAKPNFNKRKP